MIRQAFQALDAIAARLPFHLDDRARVNQTYRRWHDQGDARAKRDVDIWTYCYVRRYFLFRFVEQDAYSASDLDELVAAAYRRVEDGRARLRNPGAYAAWVNVICRNTYVSYLRQRRHHVALHTEELAAPAPDEAPLDRGHVNAVLHEAIARLPAFLRETATLRFLHACSHRVIATRLGKPEGTARSYAHKAAKLLRADAQVRALIGRDEA